MERAEAVVFGKYQLLELLARGGMAEVFKAKSHGVEGFEKILVIKRILPELGDNPQFVEMFVNEAKIAVTLSHANIVQVFDLGRASDRYFIAMEYVAGLDLATVLRRGRRVGMPLPQELAVYVVSELAKGLDYAHRRKDGAQRPLHIVHRDVSPQNVLLSWEGEVKLTDFGIAKARGTVEEESGVLRGKYAYMAPEQAAGAHVDGRTDLFAAGTMLYEALCGENPFHTDSTYETLRKIRDGDYRPLRDVASEVPAELAGIVAHAMATAPDQRHSNAGRLYEELVQFLYASGRRVGAHDLSDYLQALRAAAEPKAVALEEARIEAAFEDARPAATPRPGRATRRPATTTGSLRRPTSGSIVRPRTEPREVSLVVLADQSVALRSEAVLRQVQRLGGQLVVHAGEPSVVFGAKAPDGRDAEAAARFALRLVGLLPGARVGLVTAQILVAVSGEPVGGAELEDALFAARELAQQASDGAVLVGPAATRLLRARFVVEKSADDPDAAGTLVGERSFAEAYGKFVGRRDELRRLGELFALANRGRLRLIAVSGEPGSGKTRLLHETMRRLRLGGHDVGIAFASCTTQSREVPLSAMQEITRALIGVDEIDPPHVAREKVERLRELGLGAEQLDAIAAMLGLPTETDAPSGGRPLRAALLRIASALAKDRLTVFVWDGVESMDDESRALLDGLLRGAADARIAVVLSYRSGFVHPWSDLPGYHDVHVGPLPDEDVARLTATRLAVDEVPFELLREVTLKSAGNPLYVEEYLKALGDAGATEVRDGRVIYRKDVADIQVPKTLRGIVTARLARLTAEDRGVLEAAAILGDRFTAELVARSTGLTALQVAEAFARVEGRGVVVRGAASEHAFAHSLVRDVIMGGLTQDARRELHARAAVALEDAPGRPDELAERLAYHYLEAGEPARAVDQLVRAGDRQESEQALDVATATLCKALDLLVQMGSTDRDRVLALYRRVGDLAFRGRVLAEGAARMTQAIEMAEALLREEYVARFCLQRGRLLIAAIRFEEGRAEVERGRDIARRLGDRAILRDAAQAIAEAYARNGEHRRAVVHLEEALAIARETGDVQAEMRCLMPLALAHGALRETGAGLDDVAEAWRLAGVEPDRFTECELLKIESLVHYYARDYAGALDKMERALELAKEYGFPYECAVNAHNMGETLMRVGEHKRAFASLRYSYEVAREHGYTKLMMGNLRVLGFIDATKFGSVEGQQRVVEAAAYAERHGYVWDLIEGRYMLAVIDELRGAPDDARRGLLEVHRLARENGHSSYVEDAEAALRALDEGVSLPMPS